MSSFLVSAWAIDPDFIPTEVGFSILEPVKPFVEREPLFFLSSSEIINSKCNLLHYRAIISILEIHDFSTPPSSDSKGGGGHGKESRSNEEYPGYDPCYGFLGSWSSTHHFTLGVGPSGEP
jgi:hypothetical protein